MSDSALTATSPAVRKDRSHWLYVAVVVAVVLGVLVGCARPPVGCQPSDEDAQHDGDDHRHVEPVGPVLADRRRGRREG